MDTKNTETLAEERDRLAASISAKQERFRLENPAPAESAFVCWTTLLRDDSEAPAPSDT
jgi:hypothetical protein